MSEPSFENFAKSSIAVEERSYFPATCFCWIAAIIWSVVKIIASRLVISSSNHFTQRAEASYKASLLNLDS